MPLSYLFDEHLRGPLWRAVQSHNLRSDEVLDVVRVGDLPDLPLGEQDEAILRWAEREGRIVVTYDRSTIPKHLENHLSDGHHSPGVFLLPRDASIARIVSFLILTAYASDPEDWQDRIEYVRT
jgi:hypothetical protein